MDVFLWTFRGRVNFNIVYNEAFFDGGMASNFIERVKEFC